MPLDGKQPKQASRTSGSNVQITTRPRGQCPCSTDVTRQAAIADKTFKCVFDLSVHHQFSVILCPIAETCYIPVVQDLDLKQKIQLHIQEPRSHTEWFNLRQQLENNFRAQASAQHSKENDPKCREGLNRFLLEQLLSQLQEAEKKLLEQLHALEQKHPELPPKVDPVAPLPEFILPPEIENPGGIVNENRWDQVEQRDP